MKLQNGTWKQKRAHKFPACVPKRHINFLSQAIPDYDAWAAVFIHCNPTMIMILLFLSKIFTTDITIVLEKLLLCQRMLFMYLTVSFITRSTLKAQTSAKPSWRSMKKSSQDHLKIKKLWIKNKSGSRLWSLTIRKVYQLFFVPCVTNLEIF